MKEGVPTRPWPTLLVRVVYSLIVGVSGASAVVGIGRLNDGSASALTVTVQAAVAGAVVGIGAALADPATRFVLLVFRRGVAGR